MSNNRVNGLKMSKGVYVLLVYGKTTCHSNESPYGFYRREINKNILTIFDFLAFL